MADEHAQMVLQTAAMQAIQAAVEAVQTAIETGGDLEAATRAVATAVSVTGRVEPLYTNSTDSTATASSTNEQFFDRSYTMAAGKMRAGEWLEVDFGVLVHGSMAGAGNLTVKGYVGTQVVFTSGAYAAAQNDIISGRLRVRLRTASAAVAEEESIVGAPGTAVLTRKQTGSLTIDPAAEQVVRFSATFAAADAGNVCKLIELTIRGAHV